jgi:hypothetical protein
MLIERGVAELQHPIYGTIKVKPVGHIEREDDPVKKLGESTVTITFTETIVSETTAELNEVAADAIDEKYEEFSEAAAEDFASALVTDNISEQKDITTALETQTQLIVDNLKPIAMADKDGLSEWWASVLELKSSILNVYSRAKTIGGRVKNITESSYPFLLNIARLSLRIIRWPSTISVSLSEKIKGYATLTADLINQYKNDPFGIEKMHAAYAAATLALTGAVISISSGAAISVAETAALTGVLSNSVARANIAAAGSTSGGGGTGASGTGSTSGPVTNVSAGTTSREDAVKVSDEIVKLFEDVITFQDTKIGQNTFIDASPQAHIAFSEVVHDSIQLIQNVSFSLPMQKIITLNRDRQVIELCAELYGTTDYLDEFIIENNFNINEIELLPMGKKVSYYVKNA